MNICILTRSTIRRARGLHFTRCPWLPFETCCDYWSVGCILFAANVEDVVIGIAHRGRLNLLVCLLQYPPVVMFQKVSSFIFIALCSMIWSLSVLLLEKIIMRHRILFSNSLRRSLFWNRRK